VSRHIFQAVQNDAIFDKFSDMDRKPHDEEGHEDEMED